MLPSREVHTYIGDCCLGYVLSSLLLVNVYIYKGGGQGPVYRCLIIRANYPEYVAAPCARRSTSLLHMGLTHLEELHLHFPQSSRCVISPRSRIFGERVVTPNKLGPPARSRLVGTCTYVRC